MTPDASGRRWPPATGSSTRGSHRPTRLSAKSARRHRSTHGDNHARQPMIAVDRVSRQSRESLRRILLDCRAYQRLIESLFPAGGCKEEPIFLLCGFGGLRKEEGLAWFGPCPAADGQQACWSGWGWSCPRRRNHHPSQTALFPFSAIDTPSEPARTRRGIPAHGHQ